MKKEEEIIKIVIVSFLLFLVILPVTLGLNSSEISIANFKFDPLIKEPEIPVELKTANDTGYYIVQFNDQ